MEATLDSYENSATMLFGAATEFIGPKEMASDLRFHLTTVYKMAASKQTNGETRKSPLFHTATIILNLTKRGNHKLAIRIVDFFARLVGGRLVFDDTAADKATLEDELLDNFEALAEYTKIARDPEATSEEKRSAAMAAIDEIKQDFQYL